MYRQHAPPQAISHRGLRISAPENSVSAFRAALESGAEGIELDVHATLDGTVVVHHDFDVTLDGTRVPIRTLEASAISRAALPGGERIPTLDETLEAVLDRAKVYIEVKASGIEADVVRCLRRHAHFIDNYAVHAFDHRVVKRVFEMMPSIRTGILQVGYPIDSVAAMRAAGASDLWQHVDFVDERLVADVHARKGRLVVWTANSEEDWSRLAHLGVDAVCTDAVDAYISWRSRSTPSGD
jgi:glycerophosphoryl diester phosphodiesterase